jgi:hypothetical protein
LHFLADGGELGVSTAGGGPQDRHDRYDCKDAENEPHRRTHDENAFLNNVNIKVKDSG